MQLVHEAGPQDKDGLSFRLNLLSDQRMHERFTGTCQGVILCGLGGVDGWVVEFAGLTDSRTGVVHINTIIGTELGDIETAH